MTKPKSPARNAPVKVLTAAEIIAADDVSLKALDVPEWGGRVFIKPWTAGEREMFEASLMAAGGEASRKGYRQRAVGLSLTDADGKRLFTDDEFSKLSGKSAIAVDRVFQAVDALNSVSADEQANVAGN